MLKVPTWRRLILETYIGSMGDGKLPLSSQKHGAPLVAQGKPSARSIEVDLHRFVVAQAAIIHSVVRTRLPQLQGSALFPDGLKKRS